MAQRYWWHDLRVWLIALGILLAARGVWDISRAFQFESGVDTQAYVIGIERVREGRGRSSRYARVRFTDQAGSVIEEETETRIDANKVRVGQDILVRYLPTNSRRVRVAEGLDTAGSVAWICLVAGAGVIAVGTALLMRARRSGSSAG